MELLHTLLYLTSLKYSKQLSTRISTIQFSNLADPRRLLKSRWMLWKQHEKSAARNHLKDGKSVRSCFECVFSQIIRLLQGCSITTSKLHWNDEQMGRTTSRPCANVVKIKVVVPAVVTRMNVEVSLWHRLKTVSEAVPSKAFLGNRLVYCMCWPNLGCYGGT